MDTGNDARLLPWSPELSTERLQEQRQLVGGIRSAVSMLNASNVSASGVKDDVSRG
jgi:hypothetical protein